MADRMTASRHRSYSQVRQLRTCGYAYKLERLDRAPQRPGAASIAGTAVHVATELIDTQLHESPDLGPEEAPHLVEAGLVAAFAELDIQLAKNEERGWTEDAHRSFGYRPVQNVEWYRKTGIPNSITSYVAWRLETRWPVAVIPVFGPAIEVPFNYYIEDQLIHGFIDRIFVVDGQYTPLDIKSGRKPTTDEQLGLYAAALRKALGWDITWGYYLHGLKSGTAKLTPPIRVNHWTDEKLGQVYLPATKLIDLQIFIPAPGEACFLCSVSDHCEFSQAVV